MPNAASVQRRGEGGSWRALIVKARRPEHHVQKTGVEFNFRQ
jgi:hypothetical protein